MPRVKPLPLEEIRDPELLRILEDCRELGVPDSVFVRVLAHAPGYAKAICQAMRMAHGSGNVDHGLKEIMRVRLARIAGDAYFEGVRSRKAKKEGLTEERIEAGCGDFEEDPLFTESERWALRYADRMYRAPETVDAVFYGELKKHFTEAQIMEMGAFIALHYGMQAFMRTLCALPEGESSSHSSFREESGEG